jgi:hypothetical protein
VICALLDDLNKVSGGLVCQADGGGLFTENGLAFWLDHEFRHKAFQHGDFL